MPHLMVMNPKRKKRGRVRRTFTALQRRFFGKRRKKRAAPKVVELQVNPRRKRHVRRYFGNPKRHHFRRNPKRHHFRRNPIGLGNLSGMLKNTIVPATVGGLGALAVDYVMINVVPPNLLTGLSAPLIRIGAAFILGAVAAEFAGESFGDQVTAGAVTVTMYQLTRNTIQTQWPNVQLSRYMGRWPNLAMARRRQMALKGQVVTRFRAMRGGNMPGGLHSGFGLGYIAPARAVGPGRTLARYV